MGHAKERNGKNGKHARCARHGGTGHGHGRNGRVVCPYCREKDEVIPILYGFPSDKAFLKAERGELYLGGYIAGPTSYYCKRDDREF